MASEDSDELVSGFPSIHRLCDVGDLRQPIEGCVVTAGDQFDAVSELLKVEPFRSTQRMSPEERNDRLQQILASTNDVAGEMLSVVVEPPVVKHLPHSEELTKLVKTLCATRALCHREFVSDLVSGSVAASLRTA